MAAPGAGLVSDAERGTTVVLGGTETICWAATGLGTVRAADTVRGLRCRRIGLGLPRRTLLLLGQDVRRRDANRKRNGNRCTCSLRRRAMREPRCSPSNR